MCTYEYLLQMHKELLTDYHNLEKELEQYRCKYEKCHRDNDLLRTKIILLLTLIDRKE